MQLCFSKIADDGSPDYDVTTVLIMTRCSCANTGTREGVQLTKYLRHMTGQLTSDECSLGNPAFFHKLTFVDTAGGGGKCGKE